MNEESADDSVRRTDPLLASPALPTGQTGEIERPGDEHSPWVIGLLLAAFASLISGLATLALTRDDGQVAVDGVSAAPTTLAGAVAATDDTPTASADTDVDIVDDPGVTESVVESAVGTAGSVAPSELDGRPLPAPGFVLFGDDAWPIEAACEVHLPLAPANNDVQVSSYLFRTDDGRPHVIDRRFDASTVTGDDPGIAVVFDGRSATEVVTDDEGDESGAFVAAFSAADQGDDEVVVALQPDPAAVPSCGDTVVTNEPGQFAFPYTRIVMTSCASGRAGADLFATGVTSDGGRFAAQDNADGTVTLSYTTDEIGATLIDPAASVFESDDRLGYSGVVTDGDIVLDITIDATPDRGGTCVNALQG